MKNQKPSTTSRIEAGMVNFFPTHFFVKNCVFAPKNKEEAEMNKAENEANLADAIARVASDNGMSANDVQHLFPAVLRMLKSKSDWAK